MCRRVCAILGSATGQHMCKLPCITANDTGTYTSPLQDMPLSLPAADNGPTSTWLLLTAAGNAGSHAVDDVGRGHGRHAGFDAAVPGGWSTRCFWL